METRYCCSGEVKQAYIVTSASMSNPALPTIKTRFLIISDTHNFESDEDESSPFRLPVPKVDVALHCGDLTHRGGACSYKIAMEMLGAIDAELKVVIAGNHNLDLDKPYWNTHLSGDDRPEDHARAIRVMTGQVAAKNGVTYLEEGTYRFQLTDGAGFAIHVSPYSPEFCD